MGRLIIFVDAEETDVQIVAGIFEIIGIAAEEGGIEFRRKDQAHVGVLLIFIEVIHRAGVKSDHIAAQFRLGGALLLDGGHRRALGLPLIGNGQARLRRDVHFRGDVFNFLEDV